MRRIDTLDDIAEGLEALLQAHPELDVIAKRAGPLPLRRSEPGFESLASVIVSQQVSKASAASIWGRLVTLINPLTPENYLAAGEEAWRLAGLSRAKQATLARISEAIMAGELDLHGLCHQPIDEAMAAMTSVKGIGPWTAEVYLLFSAGHADVFPSGDVALQHAYAHAFAESARPDSKALRQFAERWSPWRGVAARLFWAYYAATRGRDGTPIA
jgi:DNA-3-methyladenine glycosylase II